MRRLISISTAAALLFSLVSPLLAQTCMKNMVHASCHRLSQSASHHHCDGMTEHHHEDEMPVPIQSDSINASPSNCPMNCCLSARAGVQAAVATQMLIAPQLASSAELPPVKVVFVASGFSSHTDRGPPSLS
jgi:hypothetical protein